MKIFVVMCKTFDYTCAVQAFTETSEAEVFCENLNKNPTLVVNFIGPLDPGYDPSYHKDDEFYVDDIDLIGKLS